MVDFIVVFLADDIWYYYHSYDVLNFKRKIRKRIYHTDDQLLACCGRCWHELEVKYCFLVTGVHTISIKPIHYRGKEI